MSDAKPTDIRRQPFPTGLSAPVASPIVPSVVYSTENPDALDAQYRDGSAYTYAREGHPNADALARRIDAMEGAVGGHVTGSGMAAVSLPLLACLNAGDHLIAGDQLYGRSLRMVTQELPRLGIQTTCVDPTDAAKVAAAIRPETRMILIEVVSNPTIRVADVEGIAGAANDAGVLLAIDNTFTTPRSFCPFEHGADIIIHSVTKMLSGHSDATLGYVVAKDPEHQEKIASLGVTLGTTPSPFDCWLAARGLFTFDLRYDQAERNAEALAEHLSGVPGIKRVLYPTRPDHPDHNRAMGLLKGRGGHMLSFEIDGDWAAANRFVSASGDLAFAPTLGDVGTTLSHAASSSHRALTPEARAAIGITDGFFRVSVGCEDIDLLKSDFARAAVAI